MTQKELDDKIYDVSVHIADRFRDIQSQANALKNVEDGDKVKLTLTKISDFIQEILRGYDVLDELNYEIPDKEDEYNDGYDSFSGF